MLLLIIFNDNFLEYDEIDVIMPNGQIAFPSKKKKTKMLMKVALFKGRGNDVNERCVV